MSKKIVIWGGGFAGVGVARSLLKKLDRNTDWQITLVDKNTYHTYTAALYEVATGYKKRDTHFLEKAGSVVALPFGDIFSDERLTVVQEEIKDIDNIPFDFLIIALGAETNYFGVTGAKEYTFPLKTFKDAVDIQRRLKDLVRGSTSGPLRSEASEASKKHIVTVGGGFTGVETTAELACCVKRLCVDCGTSYKDIELTIIEGSDSILHQADPAVASKVQKRLSKLGINIRTGVHVTRVSKDSVELSSGETIPAEMVIWAAGVTPVPVVKNIKNMEHDKKGKLIVDANLKVVGRSNIFALGDNALFLDKKSNTPVPGTSSVAIRQAPIVADNVVASIENKELVEYKFSFLGLVVPVGGKYAVAQIGDRVFSGFPARVLHQIIALKYYISVLSATRALGMLLRGSRLFSRND